MGSGARPIGDRAALLPHGMEAPGECDLAVVGAGIVGLAVARELTARRPGLDAVVLEREADIGLHQTGRNSGVIHAGIYYEPGSLKAELCVRGARRLYDYCAERDIPHERCGKLIVARDEGELPALDELERRGRANGVPGLRRLRGEQLGEVEPHARGVAALHSPNTGIVDFRAVARSYAGDLAERGTPVVTGCAVERLEQRDGRVALLHGGGETRARFAVLCAGLAADRLAASAGASPDPRVVPFRGAYLKLPAERRELLRGLIYPVPDPRLPFLGVHLNRHLDGQVSLGPTALLVPRARSLAWPGTWRVMRRFWRTGVAELHHAARPASLVREAADYVPALEGAAVEPYFSGVRAQALGRDGELLDDFLVHESERALHVRNAPSPTATSSLALAELIADRVEARL
jgi:L-2-hydroxyglutarate oxidase